MKFSELNVTLYVDWDTIFTEEAAEKLIGDHVSVYVMGHKTMAKVVEAKLSEDERHIHLTLRFNEDDRMSVPKPSHPANEYHSYSIGEEDGSTEQA